MTLFETLVVLLLVAALLSQVARRLQVPYPTLVALAGTAAAAMPWVPQVAIDPAMALALFVAPALLSAAYDTSPHELRRSWLPLTALAVFAVVLTAAAVAGVAMAVAGLPLASAVALGAIVAPPDAAAAQAVLVRLDLPRRTRVILQGESLFNDAVALVIFGAAVAVAQGAVHPWRLAGGLLLAVPGGLLLGALAGMAYIRLWRFWSGSQSAILFEFAGTFLVWIAGERLHVSPVLAVVTFAMLLARSAPERQQVHDRVHSFSIWEAAVFVLNTIAFLMIGLQARAIVQRLPPQELWQALALAAAVLLTVIAVRVAWVMAYPLLPLLPSAERINLRGQRRLRLLMSWAGMRGVLTLATAMSLPRDFPGADLIVLSALAVVLGTVVVQGATLGPLIRRLRLPQDESLPRHVQQARDKMLQAAHAALDRLEAQGELPLERLRARYRQPPSEGEVQAERLVLQAEREALNALHRDGGLPEDAFQLLQEELDLRELSLSEPEMRAIEDV